MSRRWREAEVEADERCGGRGGGDRRRQRWSWRREVEERGGVGGEGRRWMREAEVEMEEIG